MTGSIMLEKEETKRLWEKRCGFVDISIRELYAHLCDLLSRYHWPYEEVMVDIEMTVVSKTFDTGRILVLGELECPGSVCSLLGEARQNRLNNRKVKLNDFEFSAWDVKKGLSKYHENTFDCVFSVYDFEENGVTIKEFFRVLKPSGRLILIEPLNQLGWETPNLQKGKGMRRTNHCSSKKDKVRSRLDNVGFRIDCIGPASQDSSEVMAFGVKPRYYFETNGYRFMKAETSEDLERVWNLLYRVYCLELGVEPTNSSGFLRDAYDEYSTHLLAVDGNNRAVGTMRIVPNNPDGFPMDSDFPLTKYMRANGISRGIEGGRFVIHKDVTPEDRGTVAFGLFKCLFDYCTETGVNDVFTTTMLKIVQKYSMPGFKQIGEPFRYPEPLSSVLWVPMHCDIREAYKTYLKSLSQDTETS